MNIFLGIGLAIILLFVFGYKLFPAKSRKRKAKQNRISESIQELAQETSEFSQHPFHCVSIDAKTHSCSESKGIVGKRFLSKVAPRLPLSQCDNPNCQCRYIHHEDRREPSSDRRVDFGLPQMLYGAYGEENRRLKPRGRRTTDH